MFKKSMIFLKRQNKKEKKKKKKEPVGGPARART